MSRSAVRMGSAVVRVLFVAVLAAGVLVMHSAGHPDGVSGQGAAHSAAMSSDGHAVDSAPVSHANAAAPAESAESAAPLVRGDGVAMTMASVCLAVLSTWAFARLLRAAFTGAGVPTVLLSAVRGGIPRPEPPPRPPDLSRLSVLRI